MLLANIRNELGRTKIPMFWESPALDTLSAWELTLNDFYTRFKKIFINRNPIQAKEK